MTELPDESASPSNTAAVAPVPRPGVPAWRVGKPDAALAADVDTARNAVLAIAAADEIGRHVGARSEGMRCVTHLFESNKAGYRGWVWFATLARVSRGKTSTVNEVGLLPTEDSVLAPAWVPWSDRVRPEDQQAADDAAGLGAQGEPDRQDAAGVDTAGEDAEELVDEQEAWEDVSEDAADAKPSDGDLAESN